MTQLEVINKLQRALVGGEQHLLDQIPSTLALVIEQRIWAKCANRKGEPFATFEAFAAHPLWWGLESSIDDLLAFCRKRPEVQSLIRKEVAPIPAHGEVGNGRSRDNNIMSTEQGTSATYTLRRLKRDNPDLAEQVATGKLSAHAAAIQAGFREKTFSVSVNPERAARTLRRHLAPEEIQRLIRALMDS